MITLGIDTSNYTTSCALYNSETDSVIQKRKLLPVKPGEKGIRQSDAVFHHTQALHALLGELFEEAGMGFDAVGYSDRPRDAEGSYMPCFTVGVNTALSISAATGKPSYGFSHQSGHIAAALWSCGRMDLVDKEFIAFHVSGGTTEVLHISPDSERIFKAAIIGSTLDINCGQAVDRAGIMLGLEFPCGAELEKLAAESEETYNPKVCVNNGSCSLSGLENLCDKMFSEGECKENIARFCLDFIGKTLEKMTEYAVSLYGDLPLVYSGGVMSDAIIKERIAGRFNAEFALLDYSRDNAAGAAVLACLKGKL
ncbi:MAG: peptidase M22 [Clostridia bacterium]|nr:peptidase M22 [Clostridia bacterium]